MKHFLVPFLICATLFLTISCKNDEPSPNGDLASLPEDTGGTHTAHQLGSDDSPYAYYLYTPSDYSNDGPKYPLLIFLHGSGEVGNSSADIKVLDKILSNGPPKLIKAKTWKPKYPMIVASLQCHEGWWDVTKTRQATEFLMSHYAVDTTRIYMTGLSMGGFGTWDQLAVVGAKSHITAAVPICGGGVVVEDRVKKASVFPIWAFHGDADATVSPDFDINMVKAVNDLNPKVRAKLTMYAGVGHDSWTRTYNGTGMGTGRADFDQFDMDIFEWMLQYKKE
jgi:predicted peptidase